MNQLIKTLEERLVKNIRPDHPDKSSYWRDSSLLYAKAAVALRPSVTAVDLSKQATLREIFNLGAISAPSDDIMDAAKSYLDFLSAGGQWRIALNLAAALDQPVPSQI